MFPDGPHGGILILNYQFLQSPIINLKRDFQIPPTCALEIISQRQQQQQIVKIPN